MIDEGYVKYQCDWIKSDPINSNEIEELNCWRNKFYHLGLIGIYESGIGFGNISIRAAQPGQFIISGTQTGHLFSLNEQHCTRVIDFDLDQNCLTCQGAIQASSESLTHAVIYEANPLVNAVIHVHHLELWQKLMYQVPTTAKNCRYGTPEMAKEMLRLFNADRLIEKKILVMAGHEEGIISFGKSLEEAGSILLNYYSAIAPSPALDTNQ
ncbi:MULTISPECIES: class II aldolase/adducin family protein [unclassified Coleofasciculus]|uniref:class II aldolase/adducin family protein n=1 Tax=unclassified Coleofasciculus TaxID=2692782 RepID=UPI00187EF01A|nr:MULTISPECIES: class II aldolase/adducin family protein [unclassified Coleofasciculus]MBE9129219.1 class II aldolase/adducin family protein [Coleofasciculus sp. LEGE 07081]MBE9151893.1 class II aldolase/adducin family protein [Coleofasciculus sp. LEGE 07092]